MLSGVVLNKAKAKTRLSSETKAKALCVLSEATSLTLSDGAKAAFNSCEANALYAFGETKASTRKVLLSNAKTASPNEAKRHGEAILASPMVKRKTSKAKPKASQPKKFILRSPRVPILDRLGPVNKDLMDYLSNKRKFSSEEPVHISSSQC